MHAAGALIDGTFSQPELQQYCYFWFNFMLLRGSWHLACLAWLVRPDVIYHNHKSSVHFVIWLELEVQVSYCVGWEPMENYETD